MPKAPQYWRATATDIFPSLGNDTSSTAQASGPIRGTIRSAIRRRTGTGSQVDWFTNCCRFCSLPSGSRSAIGRPTSMTVVLEGPDSVADAARTLTRLFVQNWRYVNFSLIDPGTSAREAFLQQAAEVLTALTEAERAFITAVQPVLADDGATAGAHLPRM